MGVSMGNKGKSFVFAIFLAVFQWTLSFGQVQNSGEFFNNIPSPLLAEPSVKGQVQSSSLLGTNSLPNYGLSSAQDPKTNQFVSIPTQTWSKSQNLQSFSSVNIPNYPNLDAHYRGQQRKIHRSRRYHNRHWPTSSNFGPGGDAAGIYDRYYDWNVGRYDPFYSSPGYGGRMGPVVSSFMYPPMALPAIRLLPLQAQGHTFGGIPHELIGTVAIGALLFKMLN